mmetsp:Transcript_36629/g.104238  ORF Transcript_36629/g.104238 Transcript_36629/m.104238 type:complete len:204 (-) Transcript_36629:28-639(-)
MPVNSPATISSIFKSSKQVGLPTSSSKSQSLARSEGFVSARLAISSSSRFALFGSISKWSHNLCTSSSNFGARRAGAAFDAEAPPREDDAGVVPLCNEPPGGCGGGGPGGGGGGPDREFGSMPQPMPFIMPGIMPGIMPPIMPPIMPGIPPCMPPDMPGCIDIPMGIIIPPAIPGIIPCIMPGIPPVCIMPGNMAPENGHRPR